MAPTGMSTDRPGRQWAYIETQTDENGQYQLQVPLGNVQLSTPELPAGYWISVKPGYPYDEFAVSRNAIILE